VCVFNSLPHKMLWLDKEAKYRGENWASNKSYSGQIFPLRSERHAALEAVCSSNECCGCLRGVASLNNVSE
jgi:hypothetical protein